MGPGGAHCNWLKTISYSSWTAHEESIEYALQGYDCSEPITLDVHRAWRQRVGGNIARWARQYDLLNFGLAPRIGGVRQ